MITYAQLAERYRDIRSDDDAPKYQGKYKNLPGESNSQKRLIHESRPGFTKEDVKAVTQYVKNSNISNPHELPNKESSVEKKQREGFHTSMQKAIGRDSDRNEMSSKHSGHIFRGSSHDPRSMTDANGLYTTHIPRSHSTHPGVGVSNASHARNQGSSTHAHHVTVMHHDNATGHRIVSTAGEGHGGQWHEEEVIAPPAKYKITHTEEGGIHPKTGKPILYHHMHHVETHPAWDATKSGPLSHEEKKKAENW